MAVKNLREWMKYVESSTLSEQQAVEEKGKPPAETPSAADSEPKPSTKPAGTRVQRRPDAWDLAEGRTAAPATSTVDTSERVAGVDQTGDGGTIPQRSSSLPPGEWVGEPRPKPKEPPVAKHRQAAIPAHPIKTPRIRKSDTLAYLLECLPSKDPPAPIENGNAERTRLFQKLTDPELTLRETAVLLNVCPTTIRRYTNSGILPQHRGAGNHRRFRLREVLSFARQYTEKRKEPQPES